MADEVNFYAKMYEIDRPVVRLKNWSYSPFQPAKAGDVGHDLHVVIGDDLTVQTKQSWIDRFMSEIVGWPLVVIWPFQTKTIATGIFVDQPEGVWCEIVARSSSARKHLMVFNGIIDSGYQGELFTVIRNLSLVPRMIKQGERYAQAIFHGAVRPIFSYEPFKSSERGNTGFGSSGR